MTKPDWCPQRVWDEAGDAIPATIRFLREINVAVVALQISIARAILAAEKREREACAQVCDEAAGMRKRLFDQNGGSINASKAVQAESLAQAIRNRNGE